MSPGTASKVFLKKGLITPNATFKDEPGAVIN